MRALDELFQFYLDHPEKMPESYGEQAKDEPLYRVVCDYIAGMTDQYLLRQHASFGGWGRPQTHRGESGDCFGKCNRESDSVSV